jgi:hypothetical protein
VTRRSGVGMAKVKTCRANGTSQGELRPLPEFQPEPKHPEGWDLGMVRRKCEEGDLNPHGFYPTSPSN